MVAVGAVQRARLGYRDVDTIACYFLIFEKYKHPYNKKSILNPSLNWFLVSVQQKQCMVECVSKRTPDIISTIVLLLLDLCLHRLTITSGSSVLLCLFEAPLFL